MQSGWSRRAFVSCLPLAARAQAVPSEAKRFRDASTEFEFIRLTDPTVSNCYLPPAHLTSISQRNNGLLYCSDRSGRSQLYRMDLKTGESRAMPTPGEVDPATASFLPDERSACCFAGEVLTIVSNSRSREICAVDTGWTRPPGISVAGDAQHAVFAEQKEGHSRLRLASLGRPGVTTVLEREGRISDPLLRPRRAGILYRNDGNIWLVNYDGQQDRRLRFPPGKTGPVLWSADGKTIVYLFFPEDRSKLYQVREHTPDTNEDKLIAATSQFVSFARNADASVFAGVSANKASPHILLLLRVTRREMTVCEHRSTKPEQVVVAFSPNSQRIFYHSEWQGKSTISSVQVERFVEKTDT